MRPSGFAPRIVAAVGFALAAVLLVTGCGASCHPTAEGADLVRPPEPSMELVELVDVAAEAGIDFRHGAFRWGTSADPVAMMGGGLCWIDYDRDGWLDLYAVNTWSNGEWGQWQDEVGELPSSRLYRNVAGHFVDVTEQTSTRIETRGNGCVAADFDLDGWTDLYVTSERENVLLWNQEGEGFVDDQTLASPSGAAAFGWHTGVSVGDVDGNGWPDLFVVGYADPNRKIELPDKGFPNTLEPVADLLFLNEGPVDGGRIRFREVAQEVGIEPAGAAYGLGAALSDLDLDGDLDLYVANDTNPNQLYENRLAQEGTLRFVERGVESGVGDDGAGMGVAVADGDGDGFPELVTTNQFWEKNAITRGSPDGDLAFTDALVPLGVPEFGVGSTGWGATWLDLDLDGDLDLFIATGAIPVQDLQADRQASLLLETDRSGGNTVGLDSSSTVGLDHGLHLGRGAAAADYDNDGDMDLALGTIGGQLVLLRNSGAGGSWLEIDFGSPVPGTVVIVRLADGTVMRREAQVGGSYLSSEDPRVHFGLAGAERVESLTVEWLDGSVTRLSDVEANQILRVEPES